MSIDYIFSCLLISPTCVICEGRDITDIVDVDGKLFFPPIKISKLLFFRSTLYLILLTKKKEM
jgi:hypothetical protein